MQTFLPYPQFSRSFEVLDYKRLGKQRLEAKQILMCLLGTGSTGWRNHPAVKMWQGYESAVSNYFRESILVWKARGYNNTMEIPEYINGAPMPSWLGDESFHTSHKSNLLRKDPTHYGRVFGYVPDNLDYVWPTP